MRFAVLLQLAHRSSGICSPQTESTISMLAVLSLIGFFSYTGTPLCQFHYCAIHKSLTMKQAVL
jgi:hypothetical protein